MTTLNQNQFAQIPVLGQLDLHFNTETVSAIVHVSASASTLVAGQAVKIVDEAGGVPKVVPCTADSNEVFGFIVFDRMHPSFTGGDSVEIAQAGSVMYLYATGAVARGAQVALAYAAAGGVKALAGSGGADIVGYAYDKAATAGLIRVKLGVPSFAKDA